MKTKKRMFVDYDGTLVGWRQLDKELAHIADPQERNRAIYDVLNEDGYFYNLPVHTNVVNAVRDIIQNHSDKIEVYLLSAVISDRAINDKNRLLDEILPELDYQHRIYTTDGEDKGKFIVGGVQPTDYIVEDNTHNLDMWLFRENTIKVLNGINHTKGTWKGNRIDFSRDAQSLSRDMRAVILDGEIIVDKDPSAPIPFDSERGKGLFSREGLTDREYVDNITNKIDSLHIGNFFQGRANYSDRRLSVLANAFERYGGEGYDFSKVAELATARLRFIDIPRDINPSMPLSEIKSALSKSASTFNFLEMQGRDYVVLDTETTGLGNTDEIVEIAILDKNGNELVNRTFQPYAEYSEGARAVSHITDEELASSPRFADSLADIREALGDKPIVIFNKPFDTRLIYQTIEAQQTEFTGFESKEQALEYFRDLFSRNAVCAMQSYASFYEKDIATSLTNALAEQGIEIEQTHRASGDCQDTIKLINAVAEKQRERNDMAKTYSYYNSHRPFDIGTLPTEGLLSIQNYDERTPIEGVARPVYGKATYSRLLSADEVQAYQLVADPTMKLSLEERVSGGDLEQALFVRDNLEALAEQNPNVSFDRENGTVSLYLSVDDKYFNAMMRSGKIYSPYDDMYAVADWHDVEKAPRSQRMDGELTHTVRVNVPIEHISLSNDEVGVFHLDLGDVKSISFDEADISEVDIEALRTEEWAITHADEIDAVYADAVSHEIEAEFASTRREDGLSLESVNYAMEVAGYYYDEFDSDPENGYLVYQTEFGQNVYYDSKDEVVEWLRGVEFDDAEISDEVARILADAERELAEKQRAEAVEVELTGDSATIDGKDGESMSMAEILETLRNLDVAVVGEMSPELSEQIRDSGYSIVNGKIVNVAEINRQIADDMARAEASASALVGNEVAIESTEDYPFDVGGISPANLNGEAYRLVKLSEDMRGIEAYDSRVFHSREQARAVISAEGLTETNYDYMINRVSQERARQPIVPIQEFYFEHFFAKGSTTVNAICSGHEIGSRSYNPRTDSGIGYADRTDVYNAVREFEQRNNIPNPVIDENGRYEDKDFLYMGYDEYVGKSHLGDAELQPWIAKIEEQVTPYYEERQASTDEWGKPSMDYLVSKNLAQVYYGIKNGLSNDELDYMVSQMDGRNTADMEDVRKSLESGKVDVAMMKYFEHLNPSVRSVVMEYYVREVATPDPEQLAILAKLPDNYSFAYPMASGLARGELSNEMANAIIEEMTPLVERDKQRPYDASKLNPRTFAEHFDYYDTIYPKVTVDQMRDYIKMVGERDSRDFPHIADVYDLGTSNIYEVYDSTLEAMQKNYFSDARFHRTEGNSYIFEIPHGEEFGKYAGKSVIVDKEALQPEYRDRISFPSPIDAYIKTEYDKAMSKHEPYQLEVAVFEHTDGTVDVGFIGLSDNVEKLTPEPFKNVDDARKFIAESGLLEIQKTFVQNEALQYYAMSGYHDVKIDNSNNNALNYTTAINHAREVYSGIKEREMQMPTQEQTQTQTDVNLGMSAEEMARLSAEADAIFANPNAPETEEQTNATSPVAPTSTTPKKSLTTDDLQNMLKDGINDFFNNGQYEKYMSDLAQLAVNKYSFNNTMLIMMQNPHATYVKGYAQWLEVGRQVNKGETGMSILRPKFAVNQKGEDSLFNVVKASCEAQWKKDPSIDYAHFHLGLSNMSFHQLRDKSWNVVLAGGQTLTHLNNDAELKKFINDRVIGKVITGFTAEKVFDVSQTSIPENMYVPKYMVKSDSEKLLDKNGNEQTRYNKFSHQTEVLIKNTPERIGKFDPETEKPLANPNPEKMAKLLDVLKDLSLKAHGVPLTEASRDKDKTLADPECGGYYSHRDSGDKGFIVIANDANETDKVSTALHEIAHSMMHRDLDELKTEMGLSETDKITRGMKEVQAESVAFMVAKQFGIDTELKSVPYVALWGKDKEMKDLNTSFAVIANTSKTLLTEIEKALKEHGLDMHLDELDQTPLTREQVIDATKDKFEYAIQTGNLLTDKSRALTEDYQKAGTPELKDNLAKRISLVAEVQKLVEVSKDILTQVIESPTKVEQNNLMNRLSATSNKIQVAMGEFTRLETEAHDMTRDMSVDEKLRQTYYESPIKAVRAIAKSQESMKNLTANDLKIIAESRFIKEAYGKLIGVDNAQFARLATQQLENIKASLSKNGVAVEVSFCEGNPLFEKPIFKAGQTMPPRLANKIVAEAEKTIQEARAKDVAGEKFIGYTKASINVYHITGDKLTITPPLRVDIGSGDQKNLTEFIEMTSRGKAQTALAEAFAKSTRERGEATITEAPEIVAQTTDDKERGGQAMSDWAKSVDNTRGEELDAREDLDKDKSQTQEQSGELKE